MKTATMPALRVHPELRQTAEEILRPGETLSCFVEDALRRNVELRRAQQAFIERFSCRMVDSAEASPFLRELIIYCGSAGNVALFEIKCAKSAAIIAARYRREEYHLQPRNNSSLTPLPNLSF